ncbi:hypothetical protein RRX38_23900 [Pseudomonas sp. DTU_2021_1001937_2_SI_NGA_ILE_001]|uniref:hypothetical protein n=1 Tax=Pseudomonas sp. DTU_2021_1001937_2_SI_NGA_ILE_001 TaxID=3077589 RepID=UPI0028FC165E|nr:hypothetical protein [Pseudomonas sp. DTU_2021_1001937_2_SI_NGA_ILE_001]WNW14068.1 hypothetical protein RRX38_23900 [Pseudomonas sp. DTU_2021_1001937_2_SI_NGA_ILE_001]
MREQAAMLRDLADDMLFAGLIEPLERLDMADLLTGAISYWTEERRDSWVHPASTYAVMNRREIQIGVLTGNLLCWGEFNSGMISGYLDERDSTFIYKRSHPGVEHARLFGRWLKRDGQWSVLVELRRLIDNVTRYRSVDPDAYRLAGEMCNLALEKGRFVEYWKWWTRRDFSIFQRCPACLDQIAERDSCDRCEGEGFTTMDDVPPKMPSNWPIHLERNTH